MKERSFNDYLYDVFLNVFLGLLTTSGVATLVYMTNLYENTTLIIGSLVLELICVFAFSFLIHRVPKSVAYILYFVYCAVSGVAFSIYPVIYEGGSIVLALCVTTMLFLGLAAYGYFTKKDLTVFSPYLFVALIGILISSIINFFLRSPLMDYILCWVSIIVFLVYTAFDTQKLKEYFDMESNSATTNLSIYGAFQLYLDFINLFIRILELLGRFKDDD